MQRGQEDGKTRWILSSPSPRPNHINKRNTNSVPLGLGLWHCNIQARLWTRTHIALWVELAEIWSKVASGNLPQKCPKNDDSHTSEYLSNEIQLISAGFS